MRDDLFRLLQAMTERVRADAALLEVDADEYLGRVWTEVESFAVRVGLSGSGSPPAATARPGSTRPTQTTVSMSVSECFGCLLTLICGRRLAPA